MNIQQLDKFHKTGTGYLVFGLVQLGLAYWLLSLAVNSGSIWQWGLGIVLIVAGIHNFVKSIGSFAHGKK